MEQFQGEVYGLCVRLLNHRHDAEDVTQEVFLRVHQHLPALQQGDRLLPWIYQITRNAIIDSYRSRKPTTPLEVEEVLDLPEELPDDDVVSELLPCVRAMVRSLPEVDRQLREDRAGRGVDKKHQRRKAPAQGVTGDQAGPSADTHTPGPARGRRVPTIIL